MSTWLSLNRLQKNNNDLSGISTNKMQIFSFRKWKHNICLSIFQHTLKKAFIGNT